MKGLKVKKAIDCDRCWKARKVAGQYTCPPGTDCPMMEIYEARARAGDG